MAHGPSEVLSKSGSAYEHLKRLVIEGRLRPRRRLSPNDVAGEFRTSITPIRDALVRLHAEGYIGGESGRGYFTKPFSEAEQRDLLQVLLVAMLTMFSEARAQTRGGVVEDVAAFRAEMQAAISSAEPEAAERFVRAYDELLVAVCARSRNQILPQILRNALDRTQYVRRLDARRSDRRAALAVGFDRLVEAACGDAFLKTLAAAQAFQADQLAQLSERIALANSEIERNRFP